MKLKVYLVLKKISITDFSKHLRCTRDHLSRVINGSKRASKRLAKDIEEATNGEVKAEEILQEYHGNEK